MFDRLSGGLIVAWIFASAAQPNLDVSSRGVRSSCFRSGGAAKAHHRGGAWGLGATGVVTLAIDFRYVFDRCSIDVR